MNNKKILLVDDEASLRETISELLTLNNFIVRTSENGQEALKILDFWTPDLIISDIMMPIMDGNLFYEIVRETDTINQIPFIFLTAINDEEEKEKSVLNGVDHFLTKPFKIESLIKIINIKIDRFEKVKNAYNTINASNNNYFILIKNCLNRFAACNEFCQVFCCLDIFIDISSSCWTGRQ